MCFILFDFSDGVSDGQFNICQQFEVPQLKQACRLIHPDYNPPITFIVVQKRNNTRIFRVNNNLFKEHLFLEFQIEIYLKIVVYLGDSRQ